MNTDTGITEGWIIGVVVAVIVFGVVLVPIVNGLTTETERIDIEEINESPIGELRLSMDSGATLAKTFSLEVSGGDVAVTGDWTGTLPLDTGLIIIGSDDYSVIIQDGQLLESFNGTSSSETSLTVTIADGEVNGHAYTFLYYPDSEGVYANFSSYQYGIQQSYAVGSFAGFTVASVDGTITGSNPLGLEADVQTEGDMTTGVEYVLPSEPEPEPQLEE